MTEMPARPPEPEFRPGLYEGTAADYDRFRLPYADDLIEWVQAELAIDGTGLLVDLGAGTGHVARAVRPFFARAINARARRRRRLPLHAVGAEQTRRWPQRRRSPTIHP